jgi:hypothetical protein
VDVKFLPGEKIVSVRVDVDAERESHPCKIAFLLFDCI